MKLKKVDSTKKLMEVLKIGLNHSVQDWFLHPYDVKEGRVLRGSYMGHAIDIHQPPPFQDEHGEPIFVGVYDEAIKIFKDRIETFRSKGPKETIPVKAEDWYDRIVGKFEEMQIATGVAPSEENHLDPEWKAIFGAKPKAPAKPKTFDPFEL